MDNYDIILFDLDGTLTDSKEGIINSFEYALGQFGVDPLPRAEMSKCVGPPLKYSFTNFFGFEGERLKAVLEAYQVYYRPRGIFENSVYGGVEDMLRTLRAAGKKLAVASSKLEIHVHTVLRHFDIEKYFDFIGGSDDSRLRPDKPAVIKYVIDAMPIPDLSRAVMVGDRHFDVEGARECGLETVGVLYGYGTREELEEAGARSIARDIPELTKLLLS